MMIRKFIILSLVITLAGLSQPIFAENGTLTIIKNSNLDGVAFTYFNVTNFGAEDYSKIHSVSVDNRTGTTCPMIVPPGNYSIVEFSVEGLTLTGVSCDGIMFDFSAGNDGIIIEVPPGSDVTCTFDNFVNATIFDSDFETVSEDPQCIDSEDDKFQYLDTCFTAKFLRLSNTGAIFGFNPPELQQTNLWDTLNVFCENYPRAFTKIFDEKIFPPPGCRVCEIQLEEKTLMEFQSAFPPLKQAKAGLNAEEILPKEGNTLIILEGRKIPISVTEKTAEILIERPNTNWKYISN